MKKKIYSFCFIVIMSTQLVQARAERANGQKPTIVHLQPDQVEEDFDGTPLVFQNFGGVVNSFFNLVSNPNDPQNVASSLSAMVQGMINIHHHHFRMKRSQESNSISFEDLKQQIEDEFLDFFLSDRGHRYLIDWQHKIKQRTRLINIT